MWKIVETDQKTIEQVGKDLEEAVKKRKFGVLAIHNLKETLEKKGVPFAAECRIYEVCNPLQAKKILESDLALSTVLPCRISVYQDGTKVKLATIKPTVLIEQFGKSNLKRVAEEVEGLLFEMMDEAVSGKK
jgi:uncharacterized protein (DUF302 family)